jgi:hypothetical protein
MAEATEVAAIAMMRKEVFMVGSALAVGRVNARLQEFVGSWLVGWLKTVGSLNQSRFLYLRLVAVAYTLL